MKRNIIKICMGSSCFSRGNNKNLETIQGFLKEFKIESDISIIGNLCEGKCKSGPIILVNDNLYENVTPQKIQVVLDDLREDNNDV